MGCVWLHSKHSLLRAPQNPVSRACGTLPGFSKHPWGSSRNRGVISVSLIQQELDGVMEMQPGLLLGVTRDNHQRGAGIYWNIFIYHDISSFLTWTFGTAALTGGCHRKVKAAPTWERNGKLNSDYVRKIPQRNALGEMDFRIWGALWQCSTHRILQDMQRAQASQASTSSDRRLGWTGINFQSFHSAVEKPSVLRPRGWTWGSCSAGQTQHWAAPLEQHSLLPLISAGKLLWASPVPFFPDSWIPPAPLSILPWLLSTSCFSKLSKTKVKPKLLFFFFFLLLFSRLHVEVFRISESRECFVLPISCDFQTEKWRRSNEEQCCWPAPLRHLHLQHLVHHFDPLNSFSPCFWLWWFARVYFWLTREMENINSSLILSIWTTGNVQISLFMAVKEKKVGLYLLKVIWTVTGTTSNPKGDPLWGNIMEDSHLCYL